MKPASERLSTGLCISYGFGTIGVAILLNSVSTFFPTLMSTVLGQSTALAGLLLTLSKLYDMIADLVIGATSDRTRSRWGRRRPFMLAGLVIASASLLMLFIPPAIVGPALIAYMAVALVIYSTGYSLFAVPYVAMAGEMTDDYHARTRLFSFRVFFMAIGQIAAVAGSAWLIERGGGGASGYAVMGVALAVAVAISMGVTLLGTGKARRADYVAPSVTMPFRERAGLILANRPLVLLMSAKFLQYVSIAVFSGTKILFMLNVLKLGYGGAIQLATSQNIAGAIAVPIWVIVGRRLGKRVSYLIGIVILSGTYLSWALATPGMSNPEIWLRGVFAGVGSTGMVLMSISMLPDTMEYDRLKSGGLRREGIFSSFYATVEKFGFAIGPAIIGGILALSGYIPTTGGALIAQPAAVVQALYWGAAGIPALLLVGSGLLIWNYDLDETRLLAMRKRG